MSVFEETEESFRVRGDAQTSTVCRRHEDLGTSTNPIVLCDSPVQSGNVNELSVGRPQSFSRTSRRKCALGAYVEVIEEPKPMRGASVQSSGVSMNLSSDWSQPSPSGSENARSSLGEYSSSDELTNSQCLSVPNGFEILMRCSICMEIFHNPANVSPCNHKFCYSCLLSWKRSNQTAVCPQCRGPIHSMQKDSLFSEVVESFLVTNPNKRRSSSELEALDAMEVESVSWQSRGHTRSRRRGSIPQTRSRTSSDRTIRSPFVIRVSHIRAHRAPLTNRQRGQEVFQHWID